MGKTNVFFDFETRSAVDLKISGAEIYAEDPTTDALCLAYCFDNSPVKLWKLGDPPPSDLFLELLNGARMIAHNAAFDFKIWNECCVKKYGWPALPINQLFCTMTYCYALGLPGSLENAARAVGLDEKKDMTGHRVMLQIAKPRRGSDIANGKIAWYTPESHPDKFETTYKYCIQDLVVQRKVLQRILSLSDSERELWLLDQEINQRGIPIDIRSAEIALQIIELDKDHLNARIQAITNEEVWSVTSRNAIFDWVNSRGAEMESLKAAAVEKAISRTDLDEDVIEVLKLRREGSKTSTSKIKAMLGGAGKDGRVRGCLQYHAAGTGRWGGRRIQPQNMPRPKLKQHEIDSVFDIFEQIASKKITLKQGRDFIAAVYGSPTGVISSCVRGFIAAPRGKRLIAGDWSSIESRALAWLAGEKKKIERFERDEPIYELNAVDIYGVKLEDVTEDQRQSGKTAELAFGFQGAVGAYHSMQESFGLELTPEKEVQKIKNAWRDANPNIVGYWGDLETAAFNAVSNPGKVFHAGPEYARIAYVVRGNFLFCKLPSGRVLSYPYPSISPRFWVEFFDPNTGDSPKKSYGCATEAEAEKKAKKHAEKHDLEVKSIRFSGKGVSYYGQDSTINRWIKQHAYGGLLCENVTQATARDILAGSLKVCEAEGYNVIFHVHDEIIVEADLFNGQDASGLEELMCRVPDWAKGMPLKAEAWEGKRYRK